MGACQSAVGSKDEIAANKKIEQKQKATQRDETKVMKILLLGAGESGKSTIFKQMKIIHNSGYTDDERRSMTPTVHNNLVQNMQDLLKGMGQLSIPVPDELKDHADRVEAFAQNDHVDGELVTAIKALWADEGVQKAYDQRSQFQLADSTAYYFEAIDRLTEPMFIPTLQDILRARVRTTGIVECTFEISNVTFKMFDVGGQRNERRKWIHCFDNVQAVLFVAAMSEYDQQLYEDESTNRMREALSLFSEICNSKFFAETSMMLFLNKRDLFEEKIKTSDLSVCFPEYKGGSDYEKAKDYLKDQFMMVNQNPGKQVYTHITCATDTGNVAFVFEAVKDIILTSNLRGSGFI